MSFYHKWFWRALAALFILLGAAGTQRGDVNMTIVVCGLIILCICDTQNILPKAD